jgi:hemoglobin
MKKDISSVEDISVMVFSFYESIREDKLIGPVFNNKIKDWEPHLLKMVGFWNSILFNQPTYNGSAFEAHAALPIGKEHFKRWLDLFNKNIDRQFAGPVTEMAKQRAFKIGEVFYYKIEYRKGNTEPELF